MSDGEQAKNVPQPFETVVGVPSEILARSVVTSLMFAGRDTTLWHGIIKKLIDALRSEPRAPTTEDKAESEEAGDVQH